MEKLLSEKSGKPSLLRYLVLFSVLLGAVLIGGGLVGWFMKLEGAVAIIGIGAGMGSAGEFTKALQKRHEGA